MKTLEIKEMEKIEGGDPCSSTSYALGVASLAFGFAALAFPATAPLGVLMISQSLVFGTVAAGVGAAC